MHRQFWKSHTFKFWFLGYFCILMLPLTAAVFYYGGMQRNLEAKAGEMSQMVIEQAAGVIDEKFKMIENVSDSIYMSSEIKRIKYLSLPYDASTLYELHRRAAYLGNFSFQSDLFRYLYVYYSDMHCLMDSQRLFTADNQIDAVLHTNLHMQEDTFTALMAVPHYNSFCMLEDGTILFLRTLSTRGADRKPVITLVAVINTDSIRDVLVQTGMNAEGEAWLIAPEGQGSISGSGTACPVGYSEILDAEAQGTQALANAVTVCVPSAESGMLYVLSIPNEVYLLEITQTQRWFWGISLSALCFGLLFSYSFAVHNYRPVHELKQRVSVGEDAQDDFTLINAKLSELLDEESSMQTEIKRLDNIAGKRAFHLLLSGGFDTLDIQQKSSFHFNGDVFVAAWLCRDEGEFSVRNKNGETSTESVLELVLSHLCEGRCEFVVQQESNGYVAGFCFPKGTEGMDAQIVVCGLCEKLISQMVERFPQPLDHAYVGDAHTGIEHIHESYQNALRAKEYANFMPDKHHDVVPFDPIMLSAEIPWQDYDIMDAERTFISFMLEGNYSNASHLLHEIMTYYCRTEGMNLYIMRCRMFGVMNMMLNVLHEIEPDMMDSAYGDFSPMEALVSARSPSELEKVVFDIIGQLVGAQESKNADVRTNVKQIQRYIAANYFDLNLSVQKVADAYNVSLPYLSRIFKKESGTGLLDYIIRYRVDKAKELMTSNPEESIASIAVRVGFCSSQTLIRAFKRCEGITPGHYRQSFARNRDGLSGQIKPLSDK